jgi:hypothetical protein
VPTRQTSSSGRSKSPRIQVVLPENLCQRLSALAEEESRTVSNMAKVLIQQGVERMERQRSMILRRDRQPPIGFATSWRGSSRAAPGFCGELPAASVSSGRLSEVRTEQAVPAGYGMAQTPRIADRRAPVTDGREPGCPILCHQARSAKARASRW